MYSGFFRSFSSFSKLIEVLSGGHYSCEGVGGGVEKYVPRDNRLSSLGKPRDAKR